MLTLPRTAPSIIFKTEPRNQTCFELQQEAQFNWNQRQFFHTPMTFPSVRTNESCIIKT